MLSLENDQSSWLVECLPTLNTHAWWHAYNPSILELGKGSLEVQG